MILGEKEASVTFSLDFLIPVPIPDRLECIYCHTEKPNHRALQVHLRKTCLSDVSFKVKFVCPRCQKPHLDLRSANSHFNGGRCNPTETVLNHVKNINRKFEITDEYVDNVVDGRWLDDSVMDWLMLQLFLTASSFGSTACIPLPCQFQGVMRAFANGDRRGAHSLCPPCIASARFVIIPFNHGNYHWSVGIGDAKRIRATQGT